MGPGQPAFLLAGWRYSSTTSGALYVPAVLASVMLTLPADSLASQVLSLTEQHQFWGMYVNVMCYVTASLPALMRGSQDIILVILCYRNDSIPSGLCTSC